MIANTPKEAMQWAEELAEIALEIEARLGRSKYGATPEELAGIDRGLKAAREGCFATDADIEAVFAKHRRSSRLSIPTRRCA
jgi:hypothetical protein